MSEYTKKILIVDDESSIRETLGEIISILYSYPYDLAEDGYIALQKIKEDKDNYGIILTDLKMPRMDGLQFINAAKEISEELIFIIITGFATKDNAISALKQGAYDFIHKPFNIEELNAIIDRAVNYWILKEENRNYQLNLEKLVEQRTAELLDLTKSLRSLIDLNLKINQTKEFNKRISDYYKELINLFAPSTCVLLIYDHYSKTYSTPFIHSVNDDILEIPSSSALDRNKERVLFFTPEKSENRIDPDLHFNKKDEAFALFKFERDFLLGYLYIGYKKPANFTELSDRLNLYCVNLESVLYNNHLIIEHQREKEKMFLSGIRVIADTVEASSPFTRNHSDRVEKIVKKIVEKLSFTYEEKYRLSIACILHDIGKMGIDRNILYKSDTLTDEEMKIMRLHPVLGSKIVKDLYGFKIDHIVKHHHEWWNGEGYPDGLKGTEIPIEARLIAIADAFDSMTTDRPYRKGKRFNEVIDELKAFAGKQFDPDLVEVFLQVLEENISDFQLISISELEDNG